MKPFKFTARQLAALVVLAGVAVHVMLFGGSRSGKTFLIVRCIVMRAIKAPGSRHLICRFRFNAVRAAVIRQTFPEVMRLCFPDVAWKLHQDDWYVTIPVKKTFWNENDEPEERVVNSEIWFAGLDDKERTEKILGLEFATIYPNECSQIPYSSIEVLRTRLAQKVEQFIDGKVCGLLPLRAYYDCNPPKKSHWTFKVFIRKQDPQDKTPLRRPGNYVAFQINPKDNAENLGEGYLAELEGGSARARKRFYDGEFADDISGALFKDEDIDRNRALDGDKVPQLVRVVVGVDPSGADDEGNADNDAIGMVVGGLGIDGKAYLLEDITANVGPGTWGKMATDAYHRHKANAVVAEENFGGAMVKFVIKTADPNVPYRRVIASRGKVVRAEPFSALYEKNKVVHVGHFPELEEEMTNFTTAGYMGEESPNRADAWFWILAELFPALVEEKKEDKKPYTPRPPQGAGAIFRGRR